MFIKCVDGKRSYESWFRFRLRSRFCLLVSRVYGLARGSLLLVFVRLLPPPPLSFHLWLTLSCVSSQFALVYKGFSLHQDHLLSWQLPAQFTGDQVTPGPSSPKPSCLLLFITVVSIIYSFWIVLVEPVTDNNLHQTLEVLEHLQESGTSAAAKVPGKAGRQMF